ncbi:MAG: hypothetical protein QOF08_970 [Gaiellales bacterium]|nr:hypothetical protein [Gaiellales bacterium]
MVHSSAVSSHLSRAGLLALNGLPPDVALHSLVEHANEAISQFSDGVSEDAREPYGGVVTIDGGVLRVRFGRLPRDQPDAGWLAAEREPIPLEEITESA